MITISTLQSQIALNRRNLAFLENSIREVVNDIEDLKCRISECKDEHKEQYIKNIQSSFDNLYKDLARGKKWIKKYAKLQRALKSELAYRIMYNREMRSNGMEQYQLK
jgi:DNA-binding transcriptional regulator GbsR (MarR family)